MVHYFDEKQEGELKLIKIKFKVLNLEWEFTSAGGVFSIKNLDKGTELLIKSCIIKPGMSVLDFGCGWGAVGVVLGKMNPTLKIELIDVNKRAVKLSKINVENYHLDNVKVYHSNFFSKVKGKFDSILVNPPQVAGREVCYRMIVESKDYLNKGGMLQLVARHNKGGSTLAKKMLEVFGNCRDIAKKSGYRVYVSKLNS